MERRSKIKAFSMVEMMLLLVIASLIVAASVPIVTKRHLHIPSLINHGSYACYYQEGHLMEARTSGRIEQKMLAGYPRRTSTCVFEPPAKAVMFQITAIGGGGGGGDAGYQGSERTLVSEDKMLPPFELTDNILGDIINPNNYISGNDLTKALNEIKNNYLGQLWVFAQAGNSGKAGPISYLKLIVDRQKNECPAKYTGFDSVKTRIPVTATVKLCEGCNKEKGEIGCSGEKEITATRYKCYKKDTSELVGEMVSFGNVSATCSKTIKKEWTDCEYPDPPTEKCMVNTLVGTKTHPPIYYEDYEYKAGENVIAPQVIQCTNPCKYLGQTNCENGPCYSEEQRIPIYKNCKDEVVKPQACIATPGWVEELYELKEGDCYKPCIDKPKSENITTEWTQIPPKDVKYGQFDPNDPNITCEKVNTTSENFVIELEEKVPNDECKDANGNDYDVYTDKPRYEKATYYSDEYNKGYSLFCATNPVPGQLNLKATYGLENYSGDAEMGPHVNKNAEQSFGKSFCGGTGSGGTGSCDPSVGYDKRDEYVTASIKRNNNLLQSVKSTSAQTGATGVSLKQSSKTLKKYKGTTGDSIETEQKVYFYDEIVHNGSHGINGSCSENSKTDQSYDCRKGNGENAGYCLLHHYDNNDYGNAVYNGQYHYSIAYDHDSLTKGSSGKPGEFRTIVVRSLNGIDRTINVGRGGSPATLNMGDNGTPGSPTTFGTILTANGGAGGEGRQPDTEDQLPVFGGVNDGTNYINRLKICFNPSSNVPPSNECQAWREHPENVQFYKNTSGKISDVPTRTTVGGMFSFALASLGVANNNNAINNIMKFAGRGGRGGGVQHFCWAGQRIITFEGQPLLQSSVYNYDSAPNGVPEKHKVPAACYGGLNTKPYNNISAGAGYDGALIITW